MKCEECIIEENMNFALLGTKCFTPSDEVREVRLPFLVKQFVPSNQKLIISLIIIFRREEVPGDAKVCLTKILKSQCPIIFPINSHHILLSNCCRVTVGTKILKSQFPGVYPIYSHYIEDV
jgi:hypothetical protein